MKALKNRKEGNRYMKYSVIDLFAGAGGLSLGFEKTNMFDILAFVENNDNAAQTYMKNHESCARYDDIRKLDFTKVKNEWNDIDVVIGGPPCQGFSNANRQKRRLVNGSNELVKRYVKAIEDLKPKVFVVENVKTINSDKHVFCLTTNDEKFILETLKLEIKKRDLIIFSDGKYNDMLLQIIKQSCYKDLLLINEEELYAIRNMLKKPKSIENYLNKSGNRKLIESSIMKVSNHSESFPEWYKEILENSKAILNNVRQNLKLEDGESAVVTLFCDIQRLFLGLEELDELNAIYSIEMKKSQIIITMDTYIVIDYLQAAFRNLGYEVKGEVLSAADYCVPQSRERYIMLGIKKELLKNREIKFPKPIIKNKKDYVTVKEAIEDLEDILPATESMDVAIEKNRTIADKSFYSKLVISDNNKIYNHVCTATRETALARFKKIRQGENFHSLPDELKDTYENPSRTQNTIYKRLVYDKPSDTVVNVRKSMWIHPKLNRAISAREAARIQSFPDDYVFYGTKDSVYQQIGNAVPPLLGRVVAEAVLDLLECKEKYEKLEDIHNAYEI